MEGSCSCSMLKFAQFMLCGLDKTCEYVVRYIINFDLLYRQQIMFRFWMTR